MAQLKLPSFGVKKSKDFPGYLILYCPREDCGSHVGGEQLPFVADARTMRRPMKRKTAKDTVITVTAKPCPYCFRSAYVPKRDTIS